MEVLITEIGGIQKDHIATRLVLEEHQESSHFECKQGLLPLQIRCNKKS